MILPFSQSERPGPRREIAAIPTGYRVQAIVTESPLQSRRLSSVWLIVIASVVMWLTVDLATAQTSPAPAPPATSTTSKPNVYAQRHPAPAPAANSANPADDIRDIRGPVHIKPSWMWLVYVAGVLAIGAAAYGLYRWLQARAKARAKQSYEIALEALEKARALMTPEKVREYSFAVSEITRNYIEARFGARAAHRTTEEFLHDLVAKPSGGLAYFSTLLEDFLKHCDLVKFARWTLTPEEMEQMHQSAVTFVNQTRPRETDTASSPKPADYAMRNGGGKPEVSTAA